MKYFLFTDSVSVRYFLFTDTLSVDNFFLIEYTHIGVFPGGQGGGGVKASIETGNKIQKYV